MAEHTQLQWEAKFFACDCCCVYCGEVLTLGKATKDHLIPICRGGSDKIENIVPACFSCNVKKGKRTDQEFFKDRPAFSKNRTISTANTKPKVTPVQTRSGNLDLLDRPALLVELHEEEIRVSWAWRNPA